MSALDEYAKAAADGSLDDFYKALAAFQRLGNQLVAKLAMQRTELDAAHSEEAERLNGLALDERHKGLEGQLHQGLENATQRSQFLADRWNEVNVRLKQLREGVNDLRDDQRKIVAVRAQLEAPDGAAAAE